MSPLCPDSQKIYALQVPYNECLSPLYPDSQKIYALQVPYNECLSPLYPDSQKIYALQVPYNECFSLIGKHSCDWDRGNIMLCSVTANRVRFSAGSPPDFRMWESCRTMPLVGSVPFSPRLHSDTAPYSPLFNLIGSQDLDVKSRPNMGHHGMDGLDMLDPISSTSMTTLTPMSDGSGGGHPGHHPQLHGPSVYGPAAMNTMMSGHHHHHHGGPLPPGHHPPHHHPAHPAAHHPAMAAAAAAAAGLHPDSDTDPRELEAFAERFKQRRIKLGVTQADVGKALANLKLPGVGALSQSTICRFESLTLSHNNMIALKPILQAWLEEAEAQAKNKRRDPDAPSVLPAGEKKRKRTSIAAPEKRSLEAYFAVQPRPSGEKIAAIAEKLDLKKNVVRVWFCNQRQKQKRMKFAAQH
ncbi:hypothetical protein PR048_021121 [Dryococelus australis]|uniref:POU domain protein n=1 Tax=Dryococelus australis TaxID=614101 RepID=A0ABQ9GXE9_9NEOP|nr:hypothetical protein PR048_021121 [Dryococelus australis]